MKFTYSTFIFSLILFVFCIQPGFLSYVKAQISSSAVAVAIPLDDTESVSGDIICSYQEGNRRCDSEYDTSIFGVLTDTPAAVINDPDLENPRFLADSGVARVRVSSVNGNINEGDFVTSSANAGIGQKATRNGYVVGSAIESYSSDNPDSVGVIQIVVNVHPESSLTGTRGNLLQFIRSGVAVPVFSPVESLRYLLAVAIVLISFTLGMIYFGRASRAGIEAIGRNPLAKKVIQFTVLMNIVLTLVIVLVGLGIAYLILIL